MANNIGDLHMKFSGIGGQAVMEGVMMRNGNDYAIAVSVKTKENFELVLKSKNHYDEQSQTQLSPGIYEMYSDTELIQSEFMDFQTHLYKYGEMEEYLKEVGFTQVKTYSSFDKEIAINDRCEMFLFECGL